MRNTLTTHAPAGMTPRQRFVATTLGVLAGSIATLGTLAVAAAGFSLSFDAIRATGESAHLNPALTWLLPIAVDGSLSVATVCVMVLRRMGRSTWYPWLVVVVGVAVSIACNALHAYQQGGRVPLPAEWAMAVSAVPALLLFLSVHLLTILGEAIRRRSAADTPAGTPPDRASDRPSDAASGSRPEGSPRPERRTPARANGRKPTTTDKVARLLARSPDLTKAQVAAKLGVSERTVQRAWPTPNGAQPDQG